MERKIGETFEYKGMVYKTIQSLSDSCRNCAFVNEPCYARFFNKIVGGCSMTVREDKKNIIFKEIKKDMEIKDKKLTINIPYGMEIDLQNSNFDAGVIKFKNKAIVDLKPKWNPKPFDRVVTRVDDDAIWTANIFSHIDQYGEYNTIGCVGGYPYCLPYNEETAKLIGTTNNWEG